MKNISILIFFIMLNLFWSFLFGGIKYYIRPIIGSQYITLEQIASSLAIWWVIAYIFGWALLASYHRRMIVIISWIMTGIALTVWRIWWYTSEIITTLLLIIIWCGYNLWTVLKGILITELIESNILSHTAINSLATITLLVGIIAWSYLWGLIYGDLGQSWHMIFIIVVIMTIIIWLAISMKASYPSGIISQELKKTWHAFLSILKTYWLLLICIAWLRAVSTLAWQEAIKLGISVFQQSQEHSSILLAYSAIGIIIWSIIAVRYSSSRFIISLIASIWFVVLMSWLPLIISFYPIYGILVAAAILLWLFLGILINTVEAMFFQHLWSHPYREYGSALYGLMVNTGVMIVMWWALYVSYMRWDNSIFVYGAIIMIISISLIYKKIS